MKTENWRRKCGELKIAYAQLEADQKKTLSKVRELEEQSKKSESRGSRIMELELQLKLSEDMLNHVKAKRVFTEGQLSVLKRMSGLYPEEEMTHEEWLNTSKEIISEPPFTF